MAVIQVSSKSLEAIDGQLQLEHIHRKQKKLFDSDITKSVAFRIKQLQKLKYILKENKTKIYSAIYSDFGKSSFDTYVSEMSFIFHEINLALKKLKKWSKPKRVRTGFANFPAKSYIIPEPLGTTLVIGAWNYPLQLSIIPVISSLAAGNTVILKPSEIPLNTSNVIAELVNSNFEEAYFKVLEGDASFTTELLKLKFDKIFFTGSTNVGRIVYQAAAKNMVPVSLELGGKSPVFVMSDCNLKIAVKRIVWAKFLNSGQTCVAPDYILVEDSIKESFLKALKLEIEMYYSLDAELTENYVQIINEKNFDRLVDLIELDKIYCGGNTNRDIRVIAPTVLNDVSFTDNVMAEEIFGPILPIISFTNLMETIKLVKARPKPLSCYIYSQNRKTIKQILRSLSFGGGAVNDSVMHLSNSKLPFGGVGLSGMGSYHGHFGFSNFSHHKSILDKPTWMELNLKYSPYNKWKLGLIKWMVE
jgi:aldehyde dehydrogenase (NAD+)